MLAMFPCQTVKSICCEIQPIQVQLCGFFRYLMWKFT